MRYARVHKKQAQTHRAVKRVVCEAWLCPRADHPASSGIGARCEGSAWVRVDMVPSWDGSDCRVPRRRQRIDHHGRTESIPLRLIVSCGEGSGLAVGGLLGQQDEVRVERPRRDAERVVAELTDVCRAVRRSLRRLYQARVRTCDSAPGSLLHRYRACGGNPER